MDEQLRNLSLNIIAIIIVFLIIQIFMRIYFWNEDRKMLNRAMRRIETDKLMWDRKNEAWKKRDGRS